MRQLQRSIESIKRSAKRRRYEVDLEENRAAKRRRYAGPPRASPGPGQIFSRAPSLMNLINLIKSLNANQRRIRGGGGGGGGGGGVGGCNPPPPPFHKKVPPPLLLNSPPPRLLYRARSEQHPPPLPSPLFVSGLKWAAPSPPPPYPPRFSYRT